jgi:hypothetical protein
MPQGHRGPSCACMRASARASLNACTPAAHHRDGGAGVGDEQWSTGVSMPS